MDEITYAYRPVPCPDYDVEGMESWLSDMSSRGLHLSSDGFFASLAIFEKRDAETYRYRLEAVPSKKPKAFEYAVPDAEILSVSEELGWEYVAQRGEFYIFRSKNEGTRELNTDPAVQAIAMGSLLRRMRHNFIWTVIEIIFWLWYFTRGVFFLYMTAMGTVYTLFITSLLLALGIRSALRLIHLRRLKNKLAQYGTLDHSKDWNTTAIRHYIAQLATVLTIFAAILFSMVKFSGIVLEEGYIPLEDYPVTPPFITIKDMIPSASFERESFILPNEVKKWSTLITPVNYDWQEYGSLTVSDGTKISGSLRIYYHEAATERIARRIAEEYSIRGRLQNRKTYKSVPMELPFEGYAAAYTGNLHSPCLILQRGNTVLWIRFYQFGDDRLDFADWAKIFMQSVS